MHSLSKRAVLGLGYLCSFFVVMIIVVGATGAVGVRSAASVSGSIVGDELATATSTAQVGRTIDAAHAEGVERDLTTDRARVKQLDRLLYDVTIRNADAEVTILERLHDGDGPVELAGIRQFAKQWQTLRNLLVQDQRSGSRIERAQQLDAAYTPLSQHIDALLGREGADARTGQQHSLSTENATTWAVGGAVLLAVLIAIAVGRAGMRRVQRAFEPETEQSEFAEALQVTDTESEAHELLKCHLERSIPGAQATVLNRNNSADRLEAMTSLPEHSCLTSSLQNAEPRACLAIRSARSHVHDEHSRPLLGCAVCGLCPGTTICTPFTVSGEVIGAVLVTAATNQTQSDEKRIRESVAQAAPVLANLRNLAIAEVRAATDSLTGLPNKRAVADTLKRMLAHASRTLTPLALVMIDLDHFKTINDRLGHPVGDQALANVGAAIASVLRTSDFAGRNGGEEFAVLLPDTDEQGAHATAEKIRVAVAELRLPGLDVALTASLGIAVYPEHATSAERLERLADAALYTAKRSGRNRIEVAEPLQNTMPSHPMPT